MPATKTYPASTTHEDGMRLPLWLDYKTVTYAKISPKMMKPRGIAEKEEEEEEEEEGEEEKEEEEEKEKKKKKKKTKKKKEKKKK